MDNFEKMLEELLGCTGLKHKPEVKEPSLKDMLAKYRQEEKELKARIAEVEEKMKKRGEKREIVISYTEDGIVPTVTIVKRGEAADERDTPHDVVALLDAAAQIMFEDHGVNRYALTAMLLEDVAAALVGTMQAKKKGGKTNA